MPPPSSSRFVPSIFITDGASDKHYSQEVKQEKIQEFVEAPTDESTRFVLCDDSILLSPGADMLFSYVVGMGKDNASKLIYGTRTEISPKLLTIYYSDRLNVHAKLQVASFLSLYTRIYQLKQEIDEEYFDEEREIWLNERYDESEIIELEEGPDTLVIKIIETLKAWKAVDKKILPADIAIMNNQYVYSGQLKVSHSIFFTSELLNDEYISNIISDILTSSLEVDSLSKEVIYKNGLLNDFCKRMEIDVENYEHINEAYLEHQMDRQLMPGRTLNQRDLFEKKDELELNETVEIHIQQDLKTEQACLHS